MASTVMVIEVRGRVVSLGSTIDSAFVMRRISHLSAVSTNTRQPECSNGCDKANGVSQEIFPCPIYRFSQRIVTELAKWNAHS